jgi:hypothetical protein
MKFNDETGDTSGGAEATDGGVGDEQRFGRLKRLMVIELAKTAGVSGLGMPHESHDPK